MKAILTSVAILILGLAANAQKKVDLIPADARFTPDERVELTKDFLDAEQRKYFPDPPFVPSRFATGTLNDVAYRYYFSDGSGSFEGIKDGVRQKWLVACKKDPIDDSKMCYVNRDSSLFVFLYGSGSIVVSVGASNDPGSNIAIRVDDKPAYVINERAGFHGVKAKDIVEAIAKGNTVVTRYDEFAKGRRDATFGTHGFAEAVAYLRWALTQIK